MIVADTNVVSEFMRDEPDPVVLAWASSLGSADLTISVVTVEEIERGLGRLPSGKRRSELQKRWQRQVAIFSEGILVYDVDAAKATAQVLIATQAAGRPMSLADAQIAGICLAGGHELATRNLSDFQSVPELAVVDPFA